MIPDMPKLDCPFVRKVHTVNHEDFKKYKKKYGLRKPEVYLAVPEVESGYEWVFDHPDTVAVEKIDGTNISLHVENGRIVEVQNRENPVDLLDITKRSKSKVLEGILHAVDRGRVVHDGYQYGELVGPQVQDNPYRLDRHVWIPFDYAYHGLFYKSFYEHERTYENWADWFEHYLFSRFIQKMGLRDSSKSDFAEGVVFYNYTLAWDQNSPLMAKLRRDMFAFYYPDLRIEGLDPDQR